MAHTVLAAMGSQELSLRIPLLPQGNYLTRSDGVDRTQLTGSGPSGKRSNGAHGSGRCRRQTDEDDIV